MTASNTRRLILLVEDNEQILRGNERMLQWSGYDVAAALTLAEARKIISKQTPDLIVLDIMLPDGNGLDFMRGFRMDSGGINNVPILLLTGLTTPEDIVRGLEEGGDDYLTKPYDFNVLLARIEALLRRSKSIPKVLSIGTLRFNIISNQAFFNGEDLLLSPKEYALLFLLAQNEGKPLSAEYLCETVWNHSLLEESSTLRATISTLRKKIEPSGYTVTALRNEGYFFERI